MQLQPATKAQEGCLVRAAACHQGPRRDIVRPPKSSFAGFEPDARPALKSLRVPPCSCSLPPRPKKGPFPAAKVIFWRASCLTCLRAAAACHQGPRRGLFRPPKSSFCRLRTCCPARPQIPPCGCSLPPRPKKGAVRGRQSHLLAGFMSHMPLQCLRRRIVRRPKSSCCGLRTC